MKKKPIPTFRYDAQAQSSLIFLGSLPYLIIVLTMLLLLILVFAVHWSFIGLIVLSFILYFSYDKRNRSITLDSHFMVICDRVLWYCNIEKVILHKKKQILLIETNDSREIRIDSAHFPTNARKDFKIAKNKAAKFFKVSQKIIDKVHIVSPKTQIVINE